MKYNIVGPKYGKKVKEIEQYINNLPIKEIEQKIRSGSGIEIQGVKDNEEKIVLMSNEFFIVSNALDNIAVLEEDDYIVALNTNLTKSLMLEGITREFVRHIQDIRKETQLNVMDRIIVHCNVPDEVKEAIQKHIDYIKRETLAEELIFDGLKNSDNKRKIGDYETWVNIKSV